MKTKKHSVLWVLCLLVIFSFALSSCDMADAAGIVDAQINDNGELILIYGDGTEQNLGVVVGQDGADGADGADGEDGADGQNGADGDAGADGADGSLVITTAGSSIPAASAKGLRSAVSIVCNFQATVQQGGWWPGSGSITQEYSSAGSGVIFQMDKAEGDAFIMTNYHVVYDASSQTENGISDDISVYGFNITKPTIISSS